MLCLPWSLVDCDMSNHAPFSLSREDPSGYRTWNTRLDGSLASMFPRGCRPRRHSVNISALFRHRTHRTHRQTTVRDVLRCWSLRLFCTCITARPSPRLLESPNGKLSILIRSWGCCLASAARSAARSLSAARSTKRCTLVPAISACDAAACCGVTHKLRRNTKVAV